MKLFQSPWEKEEIERWLSGLNNFFLALLLFFLPTQLGKHFWPPSSFINGIRIDYLSPTIYFTDIIIVLLVLLNKNNFRTVLRKIKTNNKDKPLILIFVLFIILSIILSPFPILGIYYLIKIVELGGLGIIIFANKNKFKPLMVKVLPFSILFESILAISQFLNKGSINGFFYFFGERSFTSQTPNIANAVINGELVLRPYATFSHPNVLASFLVLSMTILFFISNPKSKLSALWLNSVLLFGSIGLFLTMSRIAILSLLLVLIIALVKKTLKGRPNIKLIAAIFVSLFTIFFTNLHYRFIANLSDSSFVERKDLIFTSLKMIKAHSIFGVGLNNFLYQLPTYYSGGQNIFYIQPVHNVILLLTSQIGIIPVLILSYILIKIFLKSNFLGRIILFELFFLSLFDHYFLTIQQGQILLTIAVSVALINIKTSGRIESDA